MKRNVSILILFIIILIGLAFAMPGSFNRSLESLQDLWQWSIELLNEIWESIKYFWDSNIQPFINTFREKTESVIKEKIKKDKPKIDQEFKREVQEMKAETSKAGSYLLERINSLIKR